MTAIHSGGNWQTPGVKCSQTIETAPIPVGIPFSSSVKGVALMDDSISLQASLECRSPIALMIKSQEFEFSNNNIGDCCWRFGAESSTLNLDSNGQVIEPNQRMFLCTSLVKGGRTMDGERTVTEIARRTDDMEEESSSTANPIVIVKLVLKYQIHYYEGFDEDEKKDVYLYELLMPLEDFYPSSSIAMITCDVIPHFDVETHSSSNNNLIMAEDQNQHQNERFMVDTSVNDNDDYQQQPLICQFGVPRSFDFTVSSNQSTCVVLHYELDTGGEWMVCGNCEGYVTLHEMNIGKPVKVIQCDLVPLKCGVVQLPRLKVMSKGETKVTVVRDQGTQRKQVALILPTGFASGIASFVHSS